MTSFFKYPHTPHLTWLGEGTPRGDKVLAPSERAAFLSRDIVVEEKVDGANIGFSLGEDGEIRIQNRGTFLRREIAPAQFKTLFRWADARHDAISRAVHDRRILFGEWCYAVHTVRYERLPDWFLGFDVYDCPTGAFLTVAERNDVIERAGLSPVPTLATGRFTLEPLKSMLGRSELGSSRGEGLYLRAAETRAFVRSKLVSPEFTQAIGEHWSKQCLQTNAVAG